MMYLLSMTMLSVSWFGYGGDLSIDHSIQQTFEDEKTCVQVLESHMNERIRFGYEFKKWAPHPDGTLSICEPDARPNRPEYKRR